MAKKDKSMNTTEVEMKAVAKAAGAALTRAGHQVPHSVLLHALSAALNKRDWHTVKAALGAQTTQVAPVAPAYLSDTEEFEIVRESGRLYDEDNAGASITGHMLALTQERFALANGLPAPRAKGDKLVVIGEGNAYRLVNGSLQSCAVLAGDRVSGEVDANEWYEVSQDNKQTRKARKELGGAPDRATNLVTESIRGRLTPKVTARFRTDDRVFELEIDATPYLAQATEPMLSSIVACGYSGSECTDMAAEYLLDRDMDVKLTEVFAYLHTLQKSPMKDPPGFEVVINREQFLLWMDEHHDGLLAEMLCADEGILVRRLKDQDFEDNPNDWTWEVVDDGEIVEEADKPLANIREAALDAYRKKGLLQLALTSGI